MSGSGILQASRAATATGLLVLAIVALAARPAHAMPQERFYAGGGLVGSKITGDLDGQRVITKSVLYGPDVYIGKPKNGGGLSALLGVRLSTYLAAEGNVLISAHTASHERLPMQKLDTTVFSFDPAVRAMLPLGESFELFGRLGPQFMTVSYKGNTYLPPNPTPLSSTLSGYGGAVGLGAVLYIKKVGIELSALHERSRLRNLVAAEQDFDPISLSMSRTSVLLRVTLHFVAKKP